MESNISHLESKEIIQAKQLIDEGKFDEAHLLMKNFEEKGERSLYDIVSWHLLKCDILFQHGLYKELIELAEQTYKESLGLGKSLLSVDALYHMGFGLIYSRNDKKADEIIKQGEELLKTITHELPKEYKQREAYIAYIKGFFFHPWKSGKPDVDLALQHLKQSLALQEEHDDKIIVAHSLQVIAGILGFYKGDLNRAFEYIEQALTLAKKTNRKYTIARILFIMAELYISKGDLNRAIIPFERSLKMYKELNNKTLIAYILNNMSEYYRMKGELERALELIEQSLAIYEERGRLVDIAHSHDYLIQILIEKGDIERAQQCLNHLEQLNNQLKDKFVNLFYFLNKAMILKISARTRNRGKAEEILKQILEDEDSNYELNTRSLLNLCELLHMELRLTGDLEVLDDLNHYITQLSDIAENSGSFWIWGETYLLQAKSALLAFDLNEARRLLTQGQQIAEKYGFNLLAMKISSEHDELLKQLEMWEKLKESKAPLAERIKLARLNEQITLMLKKRPMEVPEVSEEDPVMILIITEGGNLLLSKKFIQDFLFEDDILGGFLTTLNYFISEIFSEGLDRAVFGQYTLLMMPISPFLICYLFKGHSYSAQHKIKLFIDSIQHDNVIWQNLQKFSQTSRSVHLKDIPSLELLIKEIFLKKKVQ